MSKLPDLKSISLRNYPCVKIMLMQLKDNIDIRLRPWPILIYLSYLWDLRKRISQYQKIAAHESRGFQFNSHIPLFYFSVYVASRRAFILFYGGALSCAPSYCVSWLSIRVSNKTSEAETIFFPLCFKPKGARVYTPERGFRRRGRKWAGKTANQICRLGKCCTGLGSYHAGNPILNESVFRGICPIRRVSFSRNYVASSHF